MFPPHVKCVRGKGILAQTGWLRGNWEGAKVLNNRRQQHTESTEDGHLRVVARLFQTPAECSVHLPQGGTKMARPRVAGVLRCWWVLAIAVVFAFQCTEGEGDDDTNVCGNGNVEEGETCDPPASCPATCDDSDSCTIDSTIGSAEQCATALT